MTKHSEFYNQFKDLNQDKLSEAFLDECKKGNVDALEYLLNSKELKHNVEKFNRLSAILEAVENGHMNVIKYLIEHTYSKESYKPYLQNHYVLDAIRIREDIPMIQYFIFELNIEKTEFMQAFLDRSTTDYRNVVAKLFETRELNNQLSQGLSDKDISHKKPKI